MWWDRITEACWEGHRMRWGRTCAERTESMALILVTLDVSRFSGWLNASAFCAESKGESREKRAVFRPAVGYAWNAHETSRSCQ